MAGAPTGRRLARRLLVLVGAVVALSLAFSGLAEAAPIPGATYSGIAADGAHVFFTVSSDGTLVSSYGITDVPGSTCQFYAGGEQGIWPGAPIADDSFTYRNYNAIVFQGTFTSPTAASGTFRFQNAATSATAACDSGTVNWTATTPNSGPSSPGGAGASGSTPGGRRSFLTRIALRKLSAARLGGRVRSPNGACVRGRKVILWRGSHRIASTTAKPNGTYSFRRAARLKGRHLRATAPLRSVPAGVCAAGSSTFITG